MTACVREMFRFGVRIVYIVANFSSNLSVLDVRLWNTASQYKIGLFPDADVCRVAWQIQNHRQEEFCVFAESTLLFLGGLISLWYWSRSHFLGRACASRWNSYVRLMGDCDGCMTTASTRQPDAIFEEETIIVKEQRRASTNEGSRISLTSAHTSSQRASLIIFDGCSQDEHKRLEFYYKASFVDWTCWFRLLFWDHQSTDCRHLKQRLICQSYFRSCKKTTQCQSGYACIRWRGEGPQARLCCWRGTPIPDDEGWEQSSARTQRARKFCCEHVKSTLVNVAWCNSIRESNKLRPTRRWFAIHQMKQKLWKKKFHRR